jgi:hypothetical protein
MNVFTGTVVKGKFAPDDSITFKLAFCQYEGKKVSVSVAQFRQKRSNAQNKYWWAVPVALIAAKMGEDDAETVHRAIIAEIHYTVTQGRDGLILKVPCSTHDLNTSEFMELIAKVQRWASTFFDGLYIPSPNEAGYDLETKNPPQQGTQ